MYLCVADKDHKQGTAIKKLLNTDDECRGLLCVHKTHSINIQKNWERWKLQGIHEKTEGILA